jgi:hypothetical protein
VNGRRAKYIKRQVKTELARRISNTPIQVITPSLWQRVKAWVRKVRNG